MELAFTPSKTCSNQNCDANNNNNNENHTCPGICSICLSPLKTPSGSITTRCNVSHKFINIIIYLQYNNNYYHSMIFIIYVCKKLNL